PEWSFQVRVAAFRLRHAARDVVPLGGGNACGDTRQSPCRRICWSPSESGSLDAAAGGLHLVLGGCGGRVHLQRDLDVEFATAQHLDRPAGPHRSASGRSSAVISPPSGTSSATLPRFTTWSSVRNGWWNPGSSGRRIC